MEDQYGFLPVIYTKVSWISLSNSTCQIPLSGFRLTFIPLLVMIGPALMTALPDATGEETRLSSPSLLLLLRRPQICRLASDISLDWSQRAKVITKTSCTHWHQQDAVVGPTQLGDAVQKHCWHPLVSVFDETENLEGEAPHLALAVLENRRLGIFVATESKEMDEACKKWLWFTVCPEN